MTLCRQSPIDFCFDIVLFNFLLGFLLDWFVILILVYYIIAAFLMQYTNRCFSFQSRLLQTYTRYRFVKDEKREASVAETRVVDLLKHGVIFRTRAYTVAGPK